MEKADEILVFAATEAIISILETILISRYGGKCEGKIALVFFNNVLINAIGNLNSKLTKKGFLHKAEGRLINHINEWFANAKKLESKEKEMH
jgi:hypothetical protein